MVNLVTKSGNTCSPQQSFKSEARATGAQGGERFPGALGMPANNSKKPR